MAIGGGIGGAIGSMEGYIGGAKPVGKEGGKKYIKKKILTLLSRVDNAKRKEDVPGGGGMATPGGGGIPKFMTAGPVFGAKLK